MAGQRATISSVSLTGVGYEVCMKIDLSAKLAAFCRELGDTALADIARQENMEPVYRRAEETLRAGRAGPELEGDLDALDAMVQRLEGQGLYPSARRTYTPLPSYSSIGRPGTGAQWWACPRGWCAGRGRVKPGQALPSCAASREALVARQLPG
jgi:hypothetical protein